MKIRPVEAKLFGVDGRTDVTKLTVVFRNFTKVTKQYTLMNKERSVWQVWGNVWECESVLAHLHTIVCPRLNNTIVNGYLIKSMHIHTYCIQIGKDNKNKHMCFKFWLPFIYICYRFFKIAYFLHII
jgi:hypothetical protein